MIIYTSFKLYLESCTDLETKIQAIDAIILALEDAILTGAANAGISEFNLDTGQSKIQQEYRSPKEVADAINGFELIRQRYINRYNGRMTRLTEGKNFVRYSNYGGGYGY